MGYTKERTTVEQEVLEFNQRVFEDLQGLPNLYDAMLAYQDGESDIINDFLYIVKKVDKYRNEKYVTTEYRFADESLDHFLKKMIKKYCKAESVKVSDSYNGRRIRVKQDTSKFEEFEVMDLFINYLTGNVSSQLFNFYFNNDVMSFEKDTIDHTLNNLRKYIRIQFEAFLNHTYEQKMDIERRMVNGQLYNVSDEHREVSFDDIVTGKTDDEGNRLSFADIMSDQDIRPYFPTKELQFIEAHWEEILTLSQQQKIRLLFEDVKNRKDPNELFSDVNVYGLNMPEVANVIYPGESSSDVISNIKRMIESVRGRVDKKMTEKGMKTKKAKIRSTMQNNSEEYKAYREQQMELLRERFNGNRLNMVGTYKEASHDSDIYIYEFVGLDENYDFELTEEQVKRLQEIHNKNHPELPFNVKAGHYKRFATQTMKSKNNREFISKEELLYLKKNKDSAKLA